MCKDTNRRVYSIDSIVSYIAIMRRQANGQNSRRFNTIHSCTYGFIFSLLPKYCDGQHKPINIFIPL
jgi:hypothetical protein